MNHLLSKIKEQKKTGVYKRESHFVKIRLKGFLIFLLLAFLLFIINYYFGQKTINSTGAKKKRLNTIRYIISIIIIIIMIPIGLIPILIPGTTLFGKRLM